MAPAQLPPDSTDARIKTAGTLLSLSMDGHFTASSNVTTMNGTFQHVNVAKTRKEQVEFFNVFQAVVPPDPKTRLRYVLVQGLLGAISLWVSPTTTKTPTKTYCGWLEQTGHNIISSYQIRDHT